MPPTERTAVITGGSGGVGGAVAMALAAQGARLALVGRRSDALEAVAAAARARGSRVDTYMVDLTRDEEVQELGGVLRRELRGVDFLVHAAGTIALGPVADTPVEKFDEQFRLNVRGAFLLTQVVLPMLRAQRGQVVFINSSAALAAHAHSSQYAATKAALKALADSLREEVNPEGIRVLSVFLGRTATAMQAEVHQWEGRTYQPERLIQPDDLAALLTSVLSLPPTTEVTEITLRPALKPLAR